MKRFNALANWFLRKPRLTSFIFSVFLLSFVGLIGFQRYQLFKEAKDREMGQILSASEAKIEQAVKSYYNVALTLAFTIDERGGSPSFESVAEQIIKNNPQIRCVQLVPKGIITKVYPLAGNEAVIGRDLFSGSEINKIEARKAVEKQKMYFQGPQELIQGGPGVIGRLPIFIENEFWGFVAIVINLDNFFKMVGVDNKRYADFQFQFSKYNTVLKKEEFFLPEIRDYVFSYSKNLKIDDGDWNLSVFYTKPSQAWKELLPSLIFGIGLVIISAYLLNRLIIKQNDLQDMFKQQGRLLNSTETKYKKIFDHAAVGIARIDSKTGQLVEVNHYLCSFLGYSPLELTHMKIKSLIHPDDLKADTLLFKQFIRGEISEFQIENRYIHRSGEIKWATVTLSPLWESGADPDQHIIIVEDSTQRKLAADILIESERKVQSLINTIDGIVWESDAKTFENIFISKKIIDILGYSPEEWLADKHFWFKKVHPLDKDRMIEVLNYTLANSKQAVSEYRFFHKNGNIVWLRDIVTVIEENDEPISLRGIMIDITEQKQAEKSLSDSFEILTEQNKRLLNFSYIVSHNLRSHASNMQGITHLIDSSEDPAERQELYGLLKNVVDNLNETLINLNHVINIQNEFQVNIEPISVREVIEKNIKILSKQILDKQIQIINEVDPELFIEHHPAYLESIILNLCSNAVRYSDSHKKPFIQFKGNEQSGYYVLEVSDNGLGIDLNRNGDRIFGMYQTFHGNPDAKGYGLFITKNQIEALQGKIELESEIGQGTTFKVYFKI